LNCINIPLKLSDLKKKQYRTAIHVGFAVLLWIIIIGFDLMNKTAIISTILMLAGYTYGPLLALFAAGLFTKLNFKDKWVPLACVMGPLVCYYVKESTLNYPTGYQIGNELILVNGIITFACLMLFRKRSKNVKPIPLKDLFLMILTVLNVIIY
jgi:hypothetical protein